jgi:hypothetical protein
MERSKGTDSLPIAAGAAAVGGLIAFLGVYLNWFTVTAGGVQAEVRGTEDWTGLVAVVAGLAALIGGGAAMLIKDSPVGKLGAALAGVGGVFAAAMAIIALLRLDAIAQDVAGGPADGDWATGLWISLIGGLVAMVGGWQSQRAEAAS